MEFSETDFAELPDDVANRWLRYGSWDRTYFPKLVGLRVDAVRLGYCRMVLPFRPELEQPMGIVHGGAIATLVDAAAVPAIGSAYGPGTNYSTIDMHVRFMSALVEEDAIAEAMVVKRGRSIVFCDVDVRGATTNKTIARGSLTYNVTQS
jgi:uncharacterized protein (TIGR00369 family)